MTDEGVQTSATEIQLNSRFFLRANRQKNVNVVLIYARTMPNCFGQEACGHLFVLCGQPFKSRIGSLAIVRFGFSSLKWLHSSCILYMFMCCKSESLWNYTKLQFRTSDFNIMCFLAVFVGQWQCVCSLLFFFFGDTSLYFIFIFIAKTLPPLEVRQGDSTLSVQTS